MDKTEEIKGIIAYIARSLTDHPDEVSVGVKDSGANSDDILTLTLSVHKDDMGKMIGRQGRTIRAIRTILNAASLRLGQRFELEILD